MREALDPRRPPARSAGTGGCARLLADELGVRPDRTTDALYAECVAGLHPAGPDLVGRQQELARAESALRAAVRGRRGRARRARGGGLGKSALCRRLAAQARDDGWTVASARRDLAQRPYVPLVEAVEQLLDRDREPGRPAPGPDRSVLAELTPLAAPAPPLDGPLSRHQVIGALRRVLLPGPDGTALLVVDDAHLADAATLDALLHLAGTSSGACWSRSPTARPRPPRVLVEGLARLDRAGAVVAVDLAPLGRDAAAALVVAAAPGRPRGRPSSTRARPGRRQPVLLVELARAGDGRAPGRAPRHRLGRRHRPVPRPGRRHGGRAGADRAAATTWTRPRSSPSPGCPRTRPASPSTAALAEGVLVVGRHPLPLPARAGAPRPSPAGAAAPARPLHRELAPGPGPPAGTGAGGAALARGERPAEGRALVAHRGRARRRLARSPDALALLDPLLGHAPDHLDGLCPARGERWRRSATRAPRPPSPRPLRVAPPRVARDPGAGRRCRRCGRATRRPRSSRWRACGRRRWRRLAHALALSGAAAMGHADPAVGLARARRPALAVETGDPARS
jgi:hypothetical protein